MIRYLPGHWAFDNCQKWLCSKWSVGWHWLSGHIHGERKLWNLSVSSTCFFPHVGSNEGICHLILLCKWARLHYCSIAPQRGPETCPVMTMFSELHPMCSCASYPPACNMTLLKKKNRTHNLISHIQMFLGVQWVSSSHNCWLKISQVKGKCMKCPQPLENHCLVHHRTSDSHDLRAGLELWLPAPAPAQHWECFLSYLTRLENNKSKSPSALLNAHHFCIIGS